MTVVSIAGLLTVADVAEAAQVSQWTVRKEIADHHLRARRIRGCWRVTQADYNAWVESLGEVAA